MMRDDGCESSGIDGRLASLRGHILADPALSARLGRIERPEALVDALLPICAEIGLAFPVDGLWRAMDAGPVPFDRWPPPGWVPARSVRTTGAPAFDWIRLDADAPVASFHGDAVAQANGRALNRMIRPRTTLDTLVAGAPGRAVAPGGFIFHLSRCGSTLAGRMLAAVPHHVVASEPEPLDAVVQWAMTADATPAAQVAALRAIVAALGRDAAGPARFFVKLDSWHTRALPLFRAAFPDVPWIFLYRDPAEIMVSQMRMRGLHTVAGALPPHVLGIADGEAMSGEDHCALALARIGAAVCEHWSLGGGLLVDYAALANAMTTRIPAHFGFAPDTHEAAAMAHEARRDAKHPTRMFVADADTKHAALSPAIDAAVRTYLAPVMRRLKALPMRP